MTENQISDYWSQDIVRRLMQRAEAAKDEGTGTGISDATHFVQAAEEISRLRCALDANKNRLVALLSWEDVSDGRVCLQARPPIGPVYWVEDDGFNEKKYGARANQLLIGNFDDLEIAKTAAQVDYNDRVLSALTKGEAQIPSPCAWQWRFKLQDGAWSDWNDGKVRRWVVEDKKKYEERALYALAPGEAKSEEPK